MSKSVLNIQELSFWERISYFESIDFIIIGAGIVGCSAALELKSRYTHAKIVVLERSYLPLGASTKNAGFACFGSPTELIDDLEKNASTDVWETVAQRWEGLIRLKEIIGTEALDFQQHGSWDIIKSTEEKEIKHISDKIHTLNSALEKITGSSHVFSEDQKVADTFGFKGIASSFYNRLEGQIDTGKMMLRFTQILAEKGIIQLNGIEVNEISSCGKILQTNIGEMNTNHTIITVNGFAKRFLKEDVAPARAQVIVTSRIPNLKLKGTFHYDAGYYYFRNFEDRILIGGGRNLDFIGETTTEIATTHPIIDSLTSLLSEVIIPDTYYSIEYQWAGIMGIGATKKPIVKKINGSLGVGVRLGGMGVAIGTNVGKEVAALF